MEIIRTHGTTEEYAKRIMQIYKDNNMQTDDFTGTGDISDELAQWVNFLDDDFDDKFYKAMNILINMKFLLQDSFGVHLLPDGYEYIKYYFGEDIIKS